MARPAPVPNRLCLAAALFLLAVAGCDIRDESPQSRQQPLLGNGSVAGLKGPPAIEYVGGHDAGRQRAHAEDRPLLLVCTATWCRFSTDMMQRTLRDSRLVALSRRAVCVLIDADRDADVCHALGVKGFPTLVVLDPDGTERLRATGRSSPDALAAALETAFEPRKLAVAPTAEPRVR